MILNHTTKIDYVYIGIGFELCIQTLSEMGYLPYADFHKDGRYLMIDELTKRYQSTDIIRLSSGYTVFMSPQTFLIENTQKKYEHVEN